MSELLEATRKKARTCRDNGNDTAALEYEAYADCIAILEAQLAEVMKCDIHEFIHYKPSLDGRKFYEVDDITAILAKSSK